MKRMILAAAALALFAGACGGETDEAQPEETVPTTSEAAATTSPSTTVAEADVPAIVPGEDADVDAVVEAYMVVFDSATTFEEKEPYLVDPSGLETTVEKYAMTGESMGGVSLDPKRVVVEGDTAVVSYDFLFGGSPSYTDLTGDAVRTAARWQITREMFCGIMRSARSACPPE